MLVLHDPATLKHQIVELLDCKPIPAYESPTRIEVLVAAIQASVPQHSLRTIVSSFTSASLNSSSLAPAPSSGDLLGRFLSETHDKDYLRHLSHIFDDIIRAQIDVDGSSELSAAEAEAEYERIKATEFSEFVVLPETFRPPMRTRNGLNTGALEQNVRAPKDIFGRHGFYTYDMATGVGKDTWAAACASAHLAVVGAELIVPKAKVPGVSREDSHKNVFAMCRPPGHHCTTDMAGGYCYLNNAVVAIQALRYHHAAQRLQQQEIDEQPAHPRITVLDLDFHHGNGTQAAFYEDPTVLYISIHGEGEYPYYTGYPEETGTGLGAGFNINLPLAMATADEYLDKLQVAVDHMKAYKPEYIVVSLGFDTFRGDPLGNFMIDTPDYERIARKVREEELLSGTPSLILLEGGYMVEKLGVNLLSFLKGWEGLA
ncbi:histone deacetylase superfamily [Mycena pura]|uniref:Histone deacetylase superfamily n=1 Tax=Mycena pura TaxID=153505 RepID=A0AAD6YSU4_9AGAR|nr:histone deacetylase superfamily [Mycena pura]